MLSLREQIDELRKLGYGADTAQAKVVHDVVLLAMYRSGFKSNSTIKGGVVMSSLTGDVRRATMDMDIASSWRKLESSEGHFRHVLPAGAGWRTKVEEICCGTCLFEFALPSE